MVYNKQLYYVFGSKRAPQDKKEPLWAKTGYLKMSVVLKNIDSEFGPNAPKGHFWVNNELRKRWGQTYIEKFWQW